MIKKLNSQFSVFVENIIEGNSTNMNKILKYLKEDKKINFMPNILPVARLNVENGKIENIQCLSFVNDTNSLNISCYPERIDFSINYELNEVDEKINETVIDVLKFIISEFRINSFRLAYNSNVIKENSIIDTLNTLNFYNEKKIKEYSYRINTEDKMIIHDSEETINIICEMGKAFNKNKNEECIFCHFDINTTEKDNRLRFNELYIDDFIKHSLIIEQKLINSLENFTNENSNNRKQ